MKIRKKGTAITTIKTLFSKYPNDDSLTLKQVYSAWGRPEAESDEKNRLWLGNKMVHLTYHNLIAPVYSHNTGRRKLVAIRLTKEGKIALGRIEGQNENEVLSSTNGHRKTLSLDEVVKAIPKLRKDNPEFEITFDVKLKSE